MACGGHAATPRPAQSATCELLAMSSSQPTRLRFSHIRHATRGGVSLANTQPFVRELGGRTHVFAHNGDLPAIYRGDACSPPPGGGRAEPPGLWCLRRECASDAAGVDDLAGVAVGTSARSVVLLASVPLSDEAWRPLAEDELLVARSGRFGK